MSRVFRRAVLALTAGIAVVLALAGPATADPALQDGLVANWTFDDGTGTTIHDAMPGAAHAEWLNNGGESWTTGILGGAVTFNPSPNPLEPPVECGALVGAPASLNQTTNVCTLSAWVNSNLLPFEVSGSFSAIYDSRTDAGCQMYLDKGNLELRAKVTTADATNKEVGAARPGIPEANLATGSWHHVVETYDGALARLYYDGQLIDMVGVGLLSESALRPTGAQLQTGQVAGIGYQPADPAVSGSVNQSFFSGSIDDMAIWNRALNANEVAYLYNGGAGRAVLSSNPIIAPPAPPVMPSPVVHLKLDGDVTNSASSGAVYDGTLVDGTTGNHSYVAGKSGQGLYLQNNGPLHKTDGDYVSIPYTITTEEGAISFWCKPGSFFSNMGVFDNSSNADDWEMWVNGGGRVQWRAEGSQYRNWIDLDSNFGAVGSWYHITAVWRKAVGSGDPGKASVTIYVNGEFGAGGDGPLIAPGTTFYLGAGNDGNEYAVATFDDLQIFDKALTSEQIAALYATYVPPIPGDTDHDGDVDATDAQKVASNWGGSVSGGADDGDFNADGVVNAADASILAANWTGSAEAAGVPEPSTLALLLASAAALLVRRRR